MSRKVGVITLHNSPNYGSCLQPYVIQVVLTRVGPVHSSLDLSKFKAAGFRIPDLEEELGEYMDALVLGGSF